MFSERKGKRKKKNEKNPLFFIVVLQTLHLLSFVPSFGLFLCVFIPDSTYVIAFWVGEEVSSKLEL